MEYLDVYDENGKYLGKEGRDVVHRDALWHNTVHCWLYDRNGNVYFQIRKNEQKLYTTASGHVKAGETIKEGLGRELEEELGIKLDHSKAELVDVYKFVMDRKKGGCVFRDRAFSNVYVCAFNGEYEEFNFDENEVSSLVKMDARDVLDLLKKGSGEIKAIVITKQNDLVTTRKQEYSFKDFLINDGETALGKYGAALEKIIELTTK